MRSQFEELKEKIENESVTERKARLAAASRDPHRPKYHFLPPVPGWYNDPKPLYSRGVCHLFFSYMPEKPYFSTNHPWGHAISTDFVSWQELPVAIAPTPNSPDSGGCMSGCVIEEKNRYYLFYTGYGENGQHQCLATSDDCISWRKYGGNPVIGVEGKPEGFGETYRDPQVWREEDGWYMAVGGIRQDGYGAVFLYRSGNLYDWRYKGILYEGKYARDEVPDFFPFAGRHVLLSSRCLEPNQQSIWKYGAYTMWATGRYMNHRFIPDSGGAVDYGKRYYAAKTFLDPVGRRILWGWILEDKPLEEQVATGWAGVQALPRLLSIKPDNTVAAEPISELSLLRKKYWGYRDITVPGETAENIRLLDAPEGKCLEIIAVFDNTGADEYGLVVLCSPDCQEVTKIGYNTQTGRFIEAPLTIEPADEVRMHVFIDISVIEAFGNNGVACTLRSYPERPDSTRIGLFARGGRARAKSIEVWEMAL